MPIHLRAEQGDYAEAVLVPGDPLRAKYIAETFFEGTKQVNGERGMLGYTGTFKGKPVSVQSTGMGCPSAAIVFEELNMLGAKKLIRVGTCGGLQPGMTMGELVIATSATPSDRTALNYTGGEMHAPTADFGLVLSAVKAATSPSATSSRATCSTSPTPAWPSAGATAARWPWRWKPPCSSPWQRCAGSGPPPCAR